MHLLRAQILGNHSSEHDTRSVKFREPSEYSRINPLIKGMLVVVQTVYKELITFYDDLSHEKPNKLIYWSGGKFVSK
jgi:hypothetical protein